MKQYELDEGDERIALMVKMAALGEEVLLTQDGVAVAEIKAVQALDRSTLSAFDLERLERLRTRLRLLPGDGAQLVSDLRDERGS